VGWAAEAGWAEARRARGELGRFGQRAESEATTRLNKKSIFQFHF
jgi:hypothetical protein